MLYYALKNQANHMHNTCIHVQKHNCLGQGDKEGGGGGGWLAVDYHPILGCSKAG